MQHERIVLLGRDTKSTRIVYNSIVKHHVITAVVFEQGGSKWKFIKRRVKRLGIIKVFGQLIFQITVPRILRQFSKKRQDEIFRKYGLEDISIDSKIVTEVTSVNSKECINFLKDVNPELILVNGTRLISRKVLDNFKCPFINTHIGITPRYRGVHGGYWALASQDSKNYGVTVHLIDSGIDTGDVLYQDTAEVTDRDNFVTYPLLQLAKGIELINKAIGDFKSSGLEKTKGTGPSKLWTHPTLGQYVINYFKYGVK